MSVRDLIETKKNQLESGDYTTDRRLLACLERVVEKIQWTYICTSCGGGGLLDPESDELPSDRKTCPACEGHGLTIDGKTVREFLAGLDRIAKEGE